MYRRALLIALFSAVLAVSLFILYLKRFESESSGGPRVRVLVVLKPLERGQQVTDDALSVREIPQAYVEDRAIRAADRSKIVGLRVGGLVQAQQTLMWTDLTVASEEHRDLAALVQPGRRAVSIEFRADAASAMIRPGDYVDVLGVVSQNGGEARSARVLLQRVLVLAVGNSLGADDDLKAGARVPGSGITLSVTLPEAQLLALSSERSALSVALRGPDDSHKAERIPDVTASTVLAAAEAERPQALRRGAPTELSARDDR
jgi:pilus assembly protein CpaB